MADTLSSPLETDFEQCGSTLVGSIGSPVILPSPIGATLEPCQIGQTLAPSAAHTTTED
jgi:hypothetical protein